MPRIPQIKKKNLLHPELSYKICGLSFDIQNERGRYLNEQQYADALEQALIDNKIEYVREKFLAESFKGEKPGRSKPDFLVENKVMVDVKAKRLITKDDYYQMKRYLASSGKELGIIINFRDRVMRPKRVLNAQLEHNSEHSDN